MSTSKFASLWSIFIGFTLLLPLFAGCTTSSPTVSAKPSPTRTLATPISSPTSSLPVYNPALCTKQNSFKGPLFGGEGYEMQGKAANAQLWVLLLHSNPPLLVHQNLYLVWRMTGTGDLTLVARGPEGVIVLPSEEDAHGGSNWSRPGDEWGSTFILPLAGCWDFHTICGNTSGDIWLYVE